MVADGRAGWDEMAAFYDATRALPAGGEAEAPALLAERLRALGVTRLLEIGVGTGRMALPLAAAGIPVVGADRSPEMVAVLRGKPGGDALPVVLCDAGALPFARAFDGVLFSHFLHLVPDLGALARQVGAAVRPGALVAVLDTGFAPEPLGERVRALVAAALGEAFRSRRGDGGSRDRDLLRALLAPLGGGEPEAVVLGAWPRSATLRGHLDDVRARKWWHYRTLPPEAVAAAADAAERELRDAGADLDARVLEPVGVRLLHGRAGA